MELTLRNEASFLQNILMQLTEKTGFVHRNIYVLCGHKDIIVRNLWKKGLLHLITVNGVQCVYPTRDKEKLYQFVKANSGAVYLNYFLEN